MSRYILFGLIILSISCSSKKNIIYLNGVDSSENYPSIYTEYKLKVDDILKIQINAESAETVTVFNNSLGYQNSNKDAILLNGYQVNSDGKINFPVLGELHVEDLTVKELTKNMIERLKNLEQLINPIIDIKLINAHFTILGEVVNPGKYDYLENNISILEAIGIAGDLTITGVRRDIKVIREIKNKTKVFSIDLTKSDFLNNNFQIFSGDIIIVNPNSTRIKNAGIIGNSGTLLSLLSFLLSSIIVLNR